MTGPAAPPGGSEPAPSPPKKISVPGATVLGVGSMVGAGIFALLGEAGAVAGAAVWISFLIGLVVTSLLAYVCVKLGQRYPSKGGLITFMVEGFGTGRLVGVGSWLGYIAAMVIVGAMVAVSFGSYATSLFVGDDAAGWWDNVFTSALIVAMVAINMVGAAVVARAQSAIVFLVLASFAFFVVVTLPDIDLDLLAFDGYPSFSKIVASVALTFFAYMGFNVITFTAGDLRDPSHDLPRAMSGALGITGLTYVLIAIAVFGTLTVAEVIQYGPTAIAEAARPALGEAGFTLMAATAMLSTAGATNATLYASGNMTGMLAETGLFPSFFGPGSRLGTKAGLLVTGGVVLVVANVVDLSAIASVGSATALVLFLLINAAAYRLRASTGSSVVLIGLATLVTAVVLVSFSVDTLRNAPQTFTAMVAIGVLAVVLDGVWRSRKPTAADSDGPAGGEALRLG
ncbi:MAG: APC family permease [Gaiella sp.]